MAQNTLHNARQQKADEFYTSLVDIENELKHYKEQFKGKVVFLNCDDPLESNFWRYFALNFTHIGLKKLIATHFEMKKPSYKLELTGDMNEDGSIDDKDIIKTPLRQNGDFRSPECIEILNQSDIVVTNPPFSLFRDYVAQLIEYNKQFVILGSQNALTYKEIFKLIKDNKVWLGYDNGGTKWFQVPNDYDIQTETRKKVVDGKKFFSMGSVYWFTNIDTTKRHEELILYKKYAPDDYIKFDNYDAINIDKVIDIPLDYNGVMDVPITFVDKYNPEQFEVVGLIAGNIRGLAGITSKSGKDGPYIKGKLKYGRILIRKKTNLN